MDNTPSAAASSPLRGSRPSDGEARSMASHTGAGVLDRLADLFDGTDTRVSCPFCNEADFDGPGLLSHLFRRCDGKAGRYSSDAEIVTALRKSAAKARGQ